MLAEAQEGAAAPNRYMDLAVLPLRTLVKTSHANDRALPCAQQRTGLPEDAG